MPKLPDVTAFGARPRANVSGPPNLGILSRAVAGQGELARSAGIGLINLGRSVGHAAATLDEAEQRRQQAVDQLAMATARSRRAAVLINAQAAFEDDPDYATYLDRFDKTADKELQSIAETLSPDLRALFDAESIDERARSRVQVQSQAQAQWKDAGRAHVDQLLADNLQTALKAQDPQTRLQLFDNTASALDAAKTQGLISDVEAGDKRRRWATDMSAAQLDILPPEDRLIRLEQGMTATADGQPLFTKTGTVLDFLPVEKRTAMIAETRREVAALEQSRNAVAERQDRLAEKRMKEEADALLKAAYDRIDAGEGLAPDVLTLLRQHPGVTPAEYKGLTTAMSGGAAEDNADYLAEIGPRLHNEDLSADLTAALRRGDLKGSTYMSLMGQNKAALKDDRPASPYKSGRDFVANGLDPGQLGGDPFVRAALKAAQSDALVDYDTWAGANPDATFEQSIETARNIRARYQNVAFDQMVLALPRPRGFIGGKQDATIEHVMTARRELLRMIQAGTISETEAAREIQSLDTWEAVLARQAAQP